MGFRHVFATVGVCATLLVTHGHAQQLTPAESEAATMSSHYAISANVVYLTANNYDAKLDVYQPGGDNPHPTLIYFHGGGWVSGTKEEAVLEVMPFLQKDWAVVNVE